MILAVLYNDTNSPQGKYMEILFDKQNKIMGGRTTKYLLEKVRSLRLSL